MRAALLVILLVALTAAAGCGVHRRVLGIFGEHATLLVRHTKPAPQEIRAAGRQLGIVPAGEVTCFTNAPTGNVRLEAYPADGGVLTRAIDVVLTEERSVLWDMDHLEILDGRAWEGACR